jgi:formate/nitrite transporter FocA (FNT family)
MFVNNLIPVTLGNIIGGAVLVGVVYWFIYLRQNRAAAPGTGSASAVSSEKK